jgi:hypothetical protein
LSISFIRNFMFATEKYLTAISFILYKQYIYRSHTMSSYNSEGSHQDQEVSKMWKK